MTTPDHRPYLIATDLRTPEDVLAWLYTCQYWFTTGATLALSVRLDRERRQACRRAAALFLMVARAHREDERDWASAEPDDTFRAAARQP